MALVLIQLQADGELNLSTDDGSILSAAERILCLAHLLDYRAACQRRLSLYRWLATLIFLDPVTGVTTTVADQFVELEDGFKFWFPDTKGEA